jgi:hypothetical protein
MIFDRTKFRCRNCNKEYSTIEEALCVLVRKNKMENKQTLKGGQENEN